MKKITLLLCLIPLLSNSISLSWCLYVNNKSSVPTDVHGDGRGVEVDMPGGVYHCNNLWIPYSLQPGQSYGPDCTSGECNKVGPNTLWIKAKGVRFTINAESFGAHDIHLDILNFGYADSQGNVQIGSKNYIVDKSDTSRRHVVQYSINGGQEKIRLAD